ncbi:MAG: guanylate kinase [Dehalococcoidia bacterium]
MTEHSNPLLIIISGPSGVGKDAILSRMREKGLPFYYSVTATSRPQRAGEVDGVDYYFIDRAEFEKMIGNGEFLEWANVYGNLYGVPKKTIKEAMAEGKDAVVKVDVQGAATIKRLEPEAVSIFITPPSMEELERRLVERKTESGTNLERRLKTAREEMQSQYSFDHVVVSQKDGIDEAIAEIEEIVNKERARPRAASLKKLEQQKTAARGKETVAKLTAERAGEEVLRIPRKSRREAGPLRFIRRTYTKLRRKK